ncbi:hypothetical protein WJX74_008386 [Apatococcus lobatus]|uniref:Uncharacterized protein n=1 Tax=Apatococcus lobatus TaxID=904363 RepID=A0AAW1QAF4_9CHLO
MVWYVLSSDRGADLGQGQPAKSLVKSQVKKQTTIFLTGWQEHSEILASIFDSDDQGANFEAFTFCGSRMARNKNKSPSAERPAAAASSSSAKTPIKASPPKLDMNTPSSHSLANEDLDSVPSTPSEASPGSGNIRSFRSKDLVSELETVRSGEISGHFSHLRPQDAEPPVPDTTVLREGEAHITEAQELSEKELLRQISELGPDTTAVVAVGSDGTRTLSIVSAPTPEEGAKAGGKGGDSPIMGVQGNPKSKAQGTTVQEHRRGSGKFPGFARAPPRRAESLLASVSPYQARRLFWWVAVPLVALLLCLLLRQYSEHLIQQSGWANSPMLARLRSRTPSMDAWTSWGSEKAHDILPEWALHQQPRTPLQKATHALNSLLGKASAVLPDGDDIAGYQTGSGLEGASQHLGRAPSGSIPGRSSGGLFQQVKSRLSGWISSAGETKDSLETSAAKAERAATHTLPDFTEGGRIPKPAPDSWAKGALKTAQNLMPNRDDIAGWQTGSGAEISQAQSKQSTVPGVPAHTADTTGSEWVDSAAAAASHAADTAKSGLDGASQSGWGRAARSGLEDAEEYARSGLDGVRDEVGSATEEGLLTRVKNVLTGAKQDAARVVKRQEADTEKLASDLTGPAKRQAMRAEEAAAGLTRDTVSSARQQADKAADGLQETWDQASGAYTRGTGKKLADSAADTTNAASDRFDAAGSTAQRKANNAAAYTRGAGGELADSVQEGAAGAQEAAADASGSLAENTRGAVGLLQQQVGSIGSKFASVLQWPYRTAARQVSYAEDVAEDQLTSGGEAIKQQASNAADRARRAAGSVKDQAWDAEEAVAGGARAATGNARRRANNAAAYSEGAVDELGRTLRHDGRQAHDWAGEQAEAAADGIHGAAGTAAGKANKAADGMRQSGRGFSSSARQAAGQAEGLVSDYADAAWDGTQDAARTAQRKVNNAAAYGQGAGEELYETAQEERRHAKAGLSDAAGKARKGLHWPFHAAKQEAHHAQDATAEAAHAASDYASDAAGTAKRKANKAAAYGQGAGEELYDTAQEEGQHAKAGLSDAAGKAKKGLHWPFHAAKQQAEHAEDLVHDTAHAASDYASDAAGTTKRKANNAAAYGQGVGEELYDTAQEEGQHAKAGLSDAAGKAKKGLHWPFHAAKKQAEHAQDTTVDAAHAASDYAKDASGTAGRKVNNAAAFSQGAGEELYRTAGEEADHVKAGLSDAAGKAKKGLHWPFHAAKKEAQHAQDATIDAAHAASDYAGDAAGTARRKVNNAAAFSQGAGEELYRTAQEEGANAKASLQGSADKAKKGLHWPFHAAKQEAQHAEDAVIDSAHAASDFAGNAAATAKRKVNNAAAFGQGAGEELSASLQEEAANARGAASDSANSVLDTTKAATGLLTQQAASLYQKTQGALTWPFTSAWSQLSRAEHAVSNSAHAAVGGAKRRVNNAAAFTQGASHELADSVAEEVAEAGHAAAATSSGVANKAQGAFWQAAGFFMSPVLHARRWLGTRTGVTGAVLRSLGMQPKLSVFEWTMLYLSRTAVKAGVLGLLGVVGVTAFVLFVGSRLTQDSQAAATAEEQEISQGGAVEEEAPTPRRSSRRQGSQVSQGTSVAADDLPAVSTGHALSGLQQAASGLVASARQAMSAQPSTSHPASRMVSQTVSAAASPTTSAARYPLRNHPHHEVSGSLLIETDPDLEDEAGTRARKSARRRTTRTMAELTETE